MNLCMIGHGMMGTWHSQNLRGAGCTLHTLVGRQPGPTGDFAREYGYARWTVDLGEALAQPEIDAVIVAGPSATHAEMALAALEAGKHVLVEIPLAMSLADAEAVVARAERLGLTLGVVHPQRMRPELREICARVGSGEERLRHVQARLFIHRLENVGATGRRRSWTDNLLWHHGAHLVDTALWLAGGGDPAALSISRLVSVMAPPHALTGIPMEFSAVVETGAEQSILCSGSYHSRLHIFDVLAVTDRDARHLDIQRSVVTTPAGVADGCSEQEANGLVARDFLAAIREGREPVVSGRSVLPAMGVLQRIQDQDTSWRAGGGAA